jgi:hypothetical protein
MGELILTMATVLCKFDFKAADGPARRVEGGSPDTVLQRQRQREDEFQLYDHITAANNGPNPMIRSKGR